MRDKCAVFFDFDGTLAHTAPDMVAALHSWEKSHALPQTDYTKAQSAVSGGARALLALSGMHEDNAKYDTARKDFLARYEQTQYANTFFFDGAEKMLQTLCDDNFCWGVVTNKPRYYFTPIAHNLSLTTDSQLATATIPIASALITRDDCELGKPSPESLLLAAKLADIPPHRCVYVGDDLRDSLAAKDAGMYFIAAAWGYWSATLWKDIPHINAFASSLKSIPSLVRMIISE